MTGVTLMIDLIVSYRPAGQSIAWRSGVVQGERLYDVGEMNGPASVRGLLDLGGDAVRQIVDRTQERGNGVGIAVDSVELGPPVPDPEKVICVGLNYRAHAEEAQFEVPSYPVLFPKFANSLVGPTATVELPEVSDQIDYEGELAVIIGATCRSVDLPDARKVIAGYSVFNDVSARDLQMRTSQFMAGKALDGFAPMGPGIVPEWNVADPQDLGIVTRVNGDVVQNSRTSEMLFGISQLIASVSEIMTLKPGDIIATGTPSGVGFAATPPRFIASGDLVEVEIEAIGQIRNRFLRKENP